MEPLVKTEGRRSGVASTGSISAAEWTVQGFGVPCRWRHQGQRPRRGSRARRQVRARAVERVLVVVCHERGSGVSTMLMSANSVGSLIRIVSEAASVKGAKEIPSSVPICGTPFPGRRVFEELKVLNPVRSPTKGTSANWVAGAMIAPGIPESRSRWNSVVGFV